MLFHEWGHHRLHESNIFDDTHTCSHGVGGKFSPKHSSFSPPPNFCQLNLTKSYNVLAKNLSAISQLQGPRNCLRMPQNHSQKAQNSNTNSGGACPQTPLENCGLCLQPPSTITFSIFPPPPPPKTKILDRTLLTFMECLGRWCLFCKIG